MRYNITIYGYMCVYVRWRHQTCTSFWVSTSLRMKYITFALCALPFYIHLPNTRAHTHTHINERAFCIAPHSLTLENRRRRLSRRHRLHTRRTLNFSDLRLLCISTDVYVIFEMFLIRSQHHVRLVVKISFVLHLSNTWLQ